MVDAAKRYNELYEEELNRLRGLARDYAPQLPEYSRKEKELTREGEAQNYKMTKTTPGGYDVRLEEGIAKFGRKRAITDILDWAVRNERG